MSGFARAVAAVLTLTLAGCANFVVQHGGKHPAGGASGAKSPLGLPASRPCPGATCPTLEIDFAGGCPAGELETVELLSGPGLRTLRWRIINEGGWQFSQYSLMPAFHFTGKNGSPLPTDRVAGAPAIESGTTLVLRWNRKGDGSTPVERARFEYALNFTHADGRTCTIDPWIIDR
jgi:hypothetical protein